MAETDFPMGYQFDPERQSYCRSLQPPTITGPPWWLSLWIKPLGGESRQVVVFLGSRTTTVSYFTLEVLPGGYPAAVSMGPWHARALAVASRPLTPAVWQPVVAEWPASFRRAVYTREASGINTQAVSVPFVNELAFARASTAQPTAYFAGAVAWVALGRGILTPRQIMALLSGVDPRLVVGRGLLGSFWPLADGWGDLHGSHPLAASGDPSPLPGPMILQPGGGGLAFWTEVRGASSRAWPHIGQVQSSHVAAAKVSVLSPSWGKIAG